MSVQSRKTKVFAALAVSIMVGAIILNALGNNPPPAGAFCLSYYYRLEPVENAILSQTAHLPGRWNCIEVYYSGTKSGNIEQLVPLNSLAGPEDVNCHFVICNGLGGTDGQILTTKKWRENHLIRRSKFGFQNLNAVRICVIADGKATRPTNLQLKRAEALAEGLRRKFNIQPKYIRFPRDWQQQ